MVSSSIKIGDETVDIFIISYNTCKLTLECIESIKLHPPDCPFRVAVIDNASTDDTVSKLREKYEDVYILQNDRNYGYAKAVNIAGQLATAKYFVVANADVVFLENTIGLLVQILSSHPKIAISFCQQVYPNGEWQCSYRFYPGVLLAISNVTLLFNVGSFLKKLFYRWGIYRKGKRKIKCKYADGALLAFNKSAFEDIGMFDESFFFYSEEMDFCKRAIAKGYDIVFTNRVQVIHYRGGSSPKLTENKYKNYELLVTSKIKYCNKHLKNNLIRRFYYFSELFNAFVLFMLFSFFYIVLGCNIKWIDEKRKDYREYFRVWHLLLKKERGENE